MNKYSRVYATVDLDAVAYNMENMKHNIAEDTQMIAVVKANAYGHGSVVLSRFLEPLPYLWGFAVAAVEEAVILRSNGIKKPILILGYTFPEDYPVIVEQELRPAVFKMDMAKQLSEAAQAAGKTVHMHLAVDTGMTRIGFKDHADSIKDICEIAKFPNVEIEGLFTHFARADETSKEPAFVQIQRYQKFLRMMQDAGVDPKFKHCSNSAGIMRLKEANMDIVRAGITLYGLYPSDEVEKDLVSIKPVMGLKSHITYIKKVEAGVSISYGGTYTTTADTMVATIPVGYADGYCRGLSNKGYVLIHGKKAPILGRVCMDQMMVDVSQIPQARELDEVTLLGRDGDECITMEELGAVSGRFNYEFACLITERVPRVYLKDGKVVHTTDILHV
ncbi:MAG: alanine racemase [Lachnospiraceae bacterium]|jgi:alanine racemase